MALNPFMSSLGPFGIVRFVSLFSLLELFFWNRIRRTAFGMHYVETFFVPHILFFCSSKIAKQLFLCSSNSVFSEYVSQKQMCFLELPSPHEPNAFQLFRVLKNHRITSKEQQQRGPLVPPFEKKKEKKEGKNYVPSGGTYGFFKIKKALIIGSGTLLLLSYVDANPDLLQHPLCSTFHIIMFGFQSAVTFVTPHYVQVC